MTMKTMLKAINDITTPPNGPTKLDDIEPTIDLAPL